jgi:beta-carotene 3-hydroxylase
VSAVVVAVVSFVLMEPLTAATHRWVMHGVGVALHRSHHRRVRPGESPMRWEANDWFPVMFAAVVLIGFAVGFNVAGLDMLVPIGIGVTAYGAAYALVHDVYIHRRLPLFGDRRVPVLERLAAAHRVHHDRNGAPYGMLVPVVPSSVGARSANGSRPSHEPVEA